jgi:hypothetical protein
MNWLIGLSLGGYLTFVMAIDKGPGAGPGQGPGFLAITYNRAMQNRLKSFLFYKIDYFPMMFIKKIISGFYY